jgi:hypothetical protein
VQHGEHDIGSKCLQRLRERSVQFELPDVFERTLQRLRHLSGGRARNCGLVRLAAGNDGDDQGGDEAKNGKWRGELTTNQHTKSAGVLPLFGGREVTCVFR